MAASGTFAWNELLTSDPQRAMEFFARTLGWTFSRFDIGAPYWVIHACETMVGGPGAITAGDLDTADSYWLAFIEVDEINRRYARAINLGATEIRGPHDVPEVGRVAVLRDPTGGLIGWIQSAVSN
ncbi:VOC family protein [Rhizobiaceae bacterium n13]|uniref:VOC family protein n=1 Tax=Ferirhizobium litorale TaxID=2927786 RepID=A0AAE3U1Q7_9HYPH|nr:VOC family protein [Fererhizobium litorale]MDI7860398.1 VOC family protein [Fererhizobium litorale]MDI7920533.1 VOC family protein [Fererhizobium litorale]